MESEGKPFLNFINQVPPFYLLIFAFCFLKSIDAIDPIEGAIEIVKVRDAF